MKPGVSIRRDERQAVRVAQLHEARGLVGGVGVDRAAQVQRVAGDAGRPAGLRCAPAPCGCRRRSRRAVPAPSRCRRGRASRRACRRRAAGFPARRRAARAGRRTSTRQRALEDTTGTGVRPRTACGLVVHQHVDHAVARAARRSGPICSGREDAEAAAFDHRRAAHADVAVAVAMITSQQPSSAALPAKQRPATMPTTGTWPDQRARSWRRCGTCRPATIGMSVSPGPPAAAFGEQHHRQPRARARCRACGRSSGGCACPACRPARCRRRPSRRSASARRRTARR